MQNQIWQTFGHESNKEIFELQLESGEFFGSFLFLGPEGIGKKTLALELAQKIMKTSRLTGHPDFQILDAANSGVQEVRGFIETLNQKPFVADSKVAVIDNAQGLNLESANALLKSIEEPKSRTAIFIISSQKLLPTIQSRCGVFHFNPLSEKQLEHFSLQSNLTVNSEALALSFGSVAKLKLFLENKEAFEREKYGQSGFGQLLKQAAGERLGAISGYAEMENPDLKKLVGSWIFLAKSGLSKQPQSFTRVARLLESYEDLDTNKNKKLILQRLFLSL